MKWHETLGGALLAADDGKIFGCVRQNLSSGVWAAEANAHGGSHKDPLGDYISSYTARLAVERHVQELKTKRFGA